MRTNEDEFPWDQLSDDDRARCERDIWFFGSAFVRKTDAGYEYVPTAPEMVTPAAIQPNTPRWWVK